MYLLGASNSSSLCRERVFKDLPRMSVGFDGFDLPVSFRMDLHLKLLGSWFRDLDLESIPFVEAHRPLNGDWAFITSLHARASSKFCVFFFVAFS